MHMKEDYMRNGQLKPGYNVNVATCSDFIIGSYISSDRNDVHTLIPFMEQLQKNYEGKNIGSVVVDSGYESEENYCWFKAHAAVRSPWKNDTKSSMCQNALLNNGKLWKQRFPPQRAACFG